MKRSQLPAAFLLRVLVQSRSGRSLRSQAFPETDVEFGRARSTYLQIHHKAIYKKGITMTLNTYIVFSGQAEEAFKFYAQCLNGQIVGSFKHADTPAAAHVPADWQDKIMHIALKAGNSVLMGSDAPPDRFKQPQGFSVNIQLDEAA